VARGLARKVRRDRRRMEMISVSMRHEHEIHGIERWTRALQGNRCVESAGNDEPGLVLQEETIDEHLPAA
jgi:hypothetical protein